MRTFQIKFRQTLCVGVLFPVACHDDYKDSYLFSISAPQHIAAHDVDEVGLRVQLTHQSAEPPPEPGHTQKKGRG